MEIKVYKNNDLQCELSIINDNIISEFTMLIGALLCKGYSVKIDGRPYDRATLCDYLKQMLNDDDETCNSESTINDPAVVGGCFGRLSQQ